MSKTVPPARSHNCRRSVDSLFAQTLYVQPGSIFGVQYSVYMMFMVVIGGIGTIEGPIIGTILYFALQQTLAQYGPWYLVLLGALAVAITIWAPQGLWGLVTARTDVRLFPVGHRL